MAESIQPGVVFKKVPDTNLTTMQEQATLAIIEYIFEVGKKELKLEDFGTVTRGKVSDINWNNLSPVQKVIFDKFPVKHMNNWDWINSFYKVQKVFMGQKFGGHTVSPGSGGAKYSHYSQSDKSGFKQYITKKVKTKYGISKKDTWNPADIWLVWDINKAKKLIDDVVDESDDIKLLNNLLREFLYHHTLVGISLKMVGKTARWETVNLMGADFTQAMPTTGKAAYKYNVSKVNLPLDLKTGYFTHSLTTGKEESKAWKRDLAQLAKERPELFPDGVAHSWRDLGSALTISENKQNKYVLEIKSDHTSKAGGTDLKFEPKEIGGVARLGRADKPRVLKLIADLGEHEGLTFNSWKMYPRTLEAWERHKSKFETMVNFVIQSTPQWPISNVGVHSGKEFIDNVSLLFTEVKNLSSEEPFALNEEGYEYGRGITSKMVADNKVELSKEDWGTAYRKAKVSSDRLRFNVVSKLMEVRCYYLLKKLSTREYVKGVSNLEVWVTLIAYMAQKKGAGFGPFGKIY